jgi:hypothetical protein
LGKKLYKLTLSSSVLAIQPQNFSQVKNCLSRLVPNHKAEQVHTRSDQSAVILDCERKVSSGRGKFALFSPNRTEQVERIRLPRVGFENAIQFRLGLGISIIPDLVLRHSPND